MTSLSYASIINVAKVFIEIEKNLLLFRIAARKSGGEVKKDTTSVKDKEKAASKLLAKKTPAKPKTGEKIDRTTKRQYTRDEKKKMVRSGKRLQKDLQKGIDKPASYYQP